MVARPSPTQLAEAEPPAQYQELPSTSPALGFLIADGTGAKALAGVDDYSLPCISAKLMARERTQPVCDGLQEALDEYGVSEQILTDIGMVFTGR